MYQGYQGFIYTFLACHPRMFVHVSNFLDP